MARVTRHAVDRGVGTIARRLAGRSPGRRRRGRPALPERSDPARARHPGGLAHRAHRSRARRRLRSLLAASERRARSPPARAALGARPGATGARTSASGRGAPCARTTARRATRGSFFPHDHARSRVYRWNEDGLGGICDDRQTLCFALAFWNGRDPILKERIFGLTGPEGNHGEDAKEYWWFLDSTPTHSWMRWRYMYPQAEFPYARLVDENQLARQARSGVRARRHRDLRRRSLLGDHGRLREGVARGHADPDQRPERRPRGGDDRRAADDLVPQHVVVGHRREDAIDPARERPSRRPARTSSARACSPATARPRPLFCDNETNSERLWRRRERVGVSEGRDQRPRHLRRPDRQSAADRDEGRAALPPAGRAPARRRRSGCVSTRPASMAATSTRSCAPAPPRRTSSTAS